MKLCCSDCGNIVGETTTEGVKISLAVRGRNRRTYHVPAIDQVTCDHCGRSGRPMSRAIYDALYPTPGCRIVAELLADVRIRTALGQPLGKAA